MAKNKGKEFEGVIRQCFERVPGVSIDRIPDQTLGNKGACNISDFIVYKEPYEYYIECKSIHGNTLPFTNITDKQWKGMLEKSKIDGVFAGVIVWFIDRDVTKFIPIELLQFFKETGFKSVRYDMNTTLGNKDNIFSIIEVSGKKKRVYFDYDMEAFIKEVERRCML